MEPCQLARRAARNTFLAAAGFSLLAGAAMASEPFEVVSQVYIEIDDSHTPPGGFDVWTDEVNDLWRNMIAAAEAAGQNASPWGEHNEDAGIQLDMLSESESAAEVGVIYYSGLTPVSLTFGLVREDEEWKIADVYRDNGNSVAKLSDLLKLAPQREL